MGIGGQSIVGAQHLGPVDLVPRRCALRAPADRRIRRPDPVGVPGAQHSGEQRVVESPPGGLRRPQEPERTEGSDLSPLRNDGHSTGAHLSEAACGRSKTGPIPEWRHLSSFQHLEKGRWNRCGDPMALRPRGGSWISPGRHGRVMAVRQITALTASESRLVALVGHNPGRTGITRILSSPGRGLPRPSRLLVVHHSEPSGARTTARNRP